ncbi:hypothetical protein A3A48_03135 [Candidatus Curtissbacteria bacterium RIFCSPLOWO2_01_FULL_37_9]|uniref:Glycosyl transferase family 1 domain-containing protein n=1 Tax=Candidatus Curtissbacteria bacterium RIFCSPLOWO2_01_FULL_37_9 TaxID=1797724 RepID=A0A1F5GRH2_9BACT|nr:MAG: hypothetical protein A3A48_03135 [Candidatus Curtissbacteria bacterium RIFCSPLOWO2_01_FULL_37_9]
MSKIAFLSFYSGFVERGVETYVYELGRRLAKKHEVTVFQGGKSHLWYSKAKISKDKFKVIDFNCIGSTSKFGNNFLRKFYLDRWSLKILLFSLKAAFKVTRGKYDLVIPMNGGWQTAIYRLLSKLFNFKILISAQAGIGRDDAWNLFWKPDIFVALTKAEEKWANRFAPEVKTVLIPNGVDLFKFNPKITPVKLELKTPIVVCAAALDFYKRIDLTIRAVDRTKNLSLLLLGDGEARGNIDALGKKLLGSRYLRFLVPHAEIAKYYRVGSVFTLVSKTEAFGTAYIEAMACNLPIVATFDSSRQEIIGDAGIFTNPEDIDQYAEDLVLAVSTNYRNKPYNQALKFSWNNISEKYSNIIEEILEDR